MSNLHDRIIPRLLHVFRTLLVCLLPTAVAQAQGLPRARPDEVGLSSAALQRIAQAFQAYVDSGKLAGVVAVVARHGKLAYVASAGAMNRERGQAMRADAVFRVFSMTKPITSAAVLQLYDQGKLRLDDLVSKYIPAFATVKVYAGMYFDTRSSRRSLP